jgi:uncharacterized protein YbbK (DUF523 family)
VEKILVSACLLGADPLSRRRRACAPILQRWLHEGRLVAVFRRDGGLPTPRPPAEIVGADAGNGVAPLAVVHTRRPART